MEVYSFFFIETDFSPAAAILNFWFNQWLHMVIILYQQKLCFDQTALFTYMKSNFYQWKRSHFVAHVRPGATIPGMDQ